RYIIENFPKNFEMEEKKKLEIEDRWILSRINSTIEEATKNLESFKPDFYCKVVENFLINDLSRTYIQIARSRIQEKQDESAIYVLCYSYLNVLKLLAPIIPFLTEHIFQKLKNYLKLKEESIHLCEWPKADKKKINKKLEKKFEKTKEIIEKILAERAKKNINLRWPIKKIKIETRENIKEFVEVIKRQVNVKEIEIKKGKTKETKIWLDLSMTEELEEEGYLREIIRLMQEARKRASLRKGEMIEIYVKCSDFLKEIIKKREDLIKNKVNASSIRFEEDGTLRIRKKIKDHEIAIYF
ncbi:MAG: class I tRNA ligase family protein, partial [Candidatus Pacearchaeota archaeon]|nr:class I tRNA ligase family protein [Candidatus Pacearchaeota archaeon]